MSKAEQGAVPRSELLAQLESEVGVLLRRARRVITERARMVHPDLPGASYLILTTVQQQGPLRASELAETFEIDKGAVSRQVQHLTRLGLLRTERDPADGRASLLSVTDEAVRRLADVLAHRHKLLDERLDDWSDERLRAFVEQLGHYNDVLSEPLA